MSTNSTSSYKSDFNSYYNSSKGILKSLSPELSSKQLNKMAENIARKTQVIVESSSNREELKTNIEQYKERSRQSLSSSKRTLLDSTLEAFQKERGLILEKKKLNPEEQITENLAYNLDKEFSQAAYESIKKSMDLQSQTCKTCSKPNHVTQEGKDLLKRCARCSKVLYCSKECQTQDWPRHKKAECLQITH